jgi:hypothetical protein
MGPLHLKPSPAASANLVPSAVAKLVPPPLHFPPAKLHNPSTGATPGILDAFHHEEEAANLVLVISVPIEQLSTDYSTRPLV